MNFRYYNVYRSDSLDRRNPTKNGAMKLCNQQIGTGQVSIESDKMEARAGISNYVVIVYSNIIHAASNVHEIVASLQEIRPEDLVLKFSAFIPTLNEIKNGKVNCLILYDQLLSCHYYIIGG